MYIFADCSTTRYEEPCILQILALLHIIKGCVFRISFTLSGPAGAVQHNEAQDPLVGTLQEVLENSLQMAMQHYFRTWKYTSASPVSMSQPSQDNKDTLQNTSYRLDKPSSEQFMPLASVFRRRLLTGIGSASFVAVGANFAGVTSFILGNFPDNSRSLKLDVIYPIGGYSRCIQREEGFEFIYPSNWVGDQTLLYRAVGKAESQRLLDPPPLSGRHRNINEPLLHLVLLDRRESSMLVLLFHLLPLISQSKHLGKRMRLEKQWFARSQNQHDSQMLKAA